MDNNRFNLPQTPIQKRPSALKVLLKSLIFPLVYLASQIVVSSVYSMFASVRLATESLLTNEATMDVVVDRAMEMTMEALPMMTVIYCLITIAAAIVTVGFASGWGKTLVREMRLGDAGPINLLVALIFGVALNFATTYAIELIPVPQVMIDQYNDQIGSMMYDASPLMMLSIGLLVPIAEEVAFRIMPMRTLRGLFTGGAAALITGVVFAVAHMIPLQMLYVLPTGILLGLVFVWCGGGASIAAHIGYNSLAVVALLLAGDVVVGEPVTYTVPELLIPCLAGLVVSAICIVVLYKRRKPENEEIEVISE